MLCAVTLYGSITNGNVDLEVSIDGFHSKLESAKSLGTASGGTRLCREKPGVKSLAAANRILPYALCDALQDGVVGKKSGVWRP